MVRRAKKLAFFHFLQKNSTRLIQSICYREKFCFWIYMIKFKILSLATTSTFPAEQQAQFGAKSFTPPVLVLSHLLCGIVHSFTISYLTTKHPSARSGRVSDSYADPDNNFSLRTPHPDIVLQAVRADSCALWGRTSMADEAFHLTALLPAPEYLHDTLSG